MFRSSEVATGQTDTNYNPGVLLPNTTYSWQVVTTDFHGAQTEGPAWHFRTLNRPPHVPSSPVPESEAADVLLDAKLEWAGGDPDPGDAARYDVYFGTEPDPPLLVEDHGDPGYEPGELALTAGSFHR